ncbi:hypothetical protein [Catenuloplanes atrovinosus]|uniref:Uncharacterized protein n=1 Tax=Catenuloplanes atrovinosus TaxID=137266 RepID=A0AAE4CD29_9ACTN|nr:hypothetical protein [Catenuloplanes atrovinosus]MDR7279912.1 hypothetical protein [Catenuloplanes atrovinosus]
MTDHQPSTALGAVGDQPSAPPGSGDRPGNKRRQILAFTAACALIVAAPLLNSLLPPPAKGVLLCTEAAAVTGLLGFFIVQWWRGRPRPSHVAAGVSAALAALTPINLLFPQTVPAYSWQGIRSNLFSYDPCATSRGQRVHLTISGAGRRPTAQLAVDGPAVPKETFWLVVFAERSTPQMYFPQRQPLASTLTSPGDHHTTVELGEAPQIGSSRRISVVCATPSGDLALRDYVAHLSDPTWNDRRRALPAGTTVISNQVHHVLLD